MTTYTQEQREELIAALREEFTQEHHYETISLLVRAANMLAAPSTSQPLTNIEVEALAICRRAGHVSVSQVQRILEISYNEAGEICQSIIDKGQCNELELAPSLTPLAAPGTLINGLTEAETDVSMSVRGLKPPTVSPCHPRQSDRKE